ncbi:MAG: aminotransferase class V-fold PLP-dependent enzyme [Nannocystaceae bacterium]|nr:aminotransferase class V-fold PLP-dependent enzyme [Nannocystaceae bacterium]
MSRAPLEPDRATLEAWLAEVARAGFDALEALPHARAAGPLGAEATAIAQAVRLDFAEAPHDGGIASLVARVVAASEASLNTIGPGYLAYVPGGGIPSAALADLLACLLNRFTGLTAAAPALCRLEADVLTWLAGEFGLPAGAGGLLTSGGSLANLSALVAARHAVLGDDGRLSDARLYVSSQAHGSVEKAARIAGIPAANLCRVATDERLRMDPQALADAIARDRAAGLRPFAVVSSAGTTNTGVIDPLPAIATVAAAAGLWHHVDAAYGGAFVLCDEGRARLEGIARADSIAFDPHKGMFLPYGTGCLLVRDAARLRAAHQLDAPYLQDFDRLDRRDEVPSPTEHGPELSRDFRGLRLWLPLLLHGVGAFRAALSEKLALAQRLHAALADAAARGVPIELLAPPELSIVAWRARRRDGEDHGAWQARNAQWLARIVARGRVHLSSTVVPDGDGTPCFTMRACVLSFRTHAAHVDAAVEDIVQTAGT